MKSIRSDGLLVSLVTIGGLVSGYMRYPKNLSSFVIIEVPMAMSKMMNASILLWIPQPASSPGTFSKHGCKTSLHELGGSYGPYGLGMKAPPSLGSSMVVSMSFVSQLCAFMGL